MDKYDYLISRKNWAKLGENIVRRLADSFNKVDEQLFTEFVDLSERNKMLKQNYLEIKKIKKDIDDTDSVISLIALTLERKGVQFCNEFEKSDDMKHLDTAISLYRSSIILDEDFSVGYFQLAVTLALREEVDESQKYFELGKKVCSKLRDSVNGENDYKKANLQQFPPELIEEYEKNLTLLWSEHEKMHHLKTSFLSALSKLIENFDEFHDAKDITRAFGIEHLIDITDTPERNALRTEFPLPPGFSDSAFRFRESNECDAKMEVAFIEGKLVNVRLVMNFDGQARAALHLLNNDIHPLISNFFGNTGKNVKDKHKGHDFIGYNWHTPQLEVRAHTCPQMGSTSVYIRDTSCPTLF